MINEKIILPDNFDAKGKIKIELFEADKKVEEVQTENFIARGVKDVFYKEAMKALFVMNKPTDGYNNMFSHIGNPFELMSLTTADHAEKPNEEWIRQGREIGWAYTTGTYSGNDDKRGSYNQSESFTNGEQVHLVIDFPTHAANGTFQSIYFSREEFNNYKNNVPKEYKWQPFLNEGEGVLKAQKYNEKIWVLSSSSSSVNRSRSVSRYDNNFNHEETIELPFNILDFYIHNNNMYVCDIDNAGLKRANLSDLTEFTTIISGYINNEEILAGIVFDNENNQFVISSSRDTCSISRYDTNFNLLSNTPFDPKYSSYNQNKLVIDDDGTIIQNMGSNATVMVGNKIDALSRTDMIMGIIDDKVVLRDGSIMPKFGISSRALLPSAVTKNSQQTMKITYDFMLPSLFD